MHVTVETIGTWSVIGVTFMPFVGLGFIAIGIKNL